MNKVLKTILIIILTILTILIMTFLILVLTNKIDLDNFRFTAVVSKEIVVDKEYENKFEKIVIDSDAANIFIKESSNDKFKLVIYGDKERTEVVDNNILDIKTTTKPCHFLCVGTKISKIEIYVPDAYQNSIKIDTNYGDIQAGIVYDFNASTNYGDIEIETANNYFDLDTNYGDIEIDNVNINKDSSAVTNFGDVKIGKTNEVSIEAETDLGNKKINNNYSNSDIKLKLETNLGDVKVNN